MKQSYSSSRYLGPETTKAQANFSISNQKVDIQLLYALAHVKAAAALANEKAEVLTSEIAQAIVQVCDEIAAGKHDDSWVTDAIQGGAGTSMNMNVNELIALRVEELLELPAGSVHPIDHVNAAQSTNDVIPTGIRLALIWLLDEYLAELASLQKMFAEKAAAVGGALKVGRTHLQDAVPVAWSDVLDGYVQLLERDQKRLRAARADLLVTNMGATAVGSSIGASEVYVQSVHGFLSERTGLEFVAAENLVDATQNVDVFMHVSQLLELSALSFSKVMTDWRMMNSGPRAGLSEIAVPAQQKGSSIMAGKVNPVHLEAYNQISYQVSGNAQVARLVLLNGQFELNVMLPVFIKATVESLHILVNGVRSLRPVLEQTEIRVERCAELLDGSLCFATELNEKIGYDAAGEVVKQALAEGMTLAQVLEERGLSLE